MIDLKELCDKLNNENSLLEKELLHYRSYGIVPKLKLKDKAYTINTLTNEVVPFVVDEICYNQMGVFYKEFLSETNVRVVADSYAFLSEEEAQKEIKK